MRDSIASLLTLPNVAIIVIGLGVSLLVLLGFVISLHQRITRQQTMLVTLHSEQQSILATFEGLNKGLREVRLQLVPFEKHLSQAIDNIVALEAQIDSVRLEQDEIIAQDPQVKLYQKAGLLMREGASIDELMEACELPRAEAELMYNMHHTEKDV